MDAMNSVMAFTTDTAIYSEIAFIAIGAVALSKYLSAFLIPKTKRRWLAVCLTGILYFAFEYSMGFLMGNLPDTPLTSMLKTITVSALMFGASCFLFEREFYKQAFLLCSFAAISAIGVLLMSYITYVLPVFGWLIEYLSSDSSISPDRLAIYVKINIVANIIFSAAIYTGLLLLPIKAITRIFTCKKRRLGASETAALILPCLPALIIMYIVRVFVRAADASGAFGLQTLNESYGILILFSCVILLFTLIASVRIAQKSVLLHIEEKNTAILREQIKAVKQHDTDGMYAEIRGMRHDMKNHIENIRLLIKAAPETGNQPELDKYLSRMGETLERFAFAFQTGNAVTDVVIHGRYLEARNKSIDLTSEFLYPASFGIDAYDLAVILQNALDNAVEACEAVPETKRFIRLRSRTKAETFFVEISNSYTGTIAFDDQTGLPVTSKTNPSEHGLGISNIKRSAEKYHGGIDIRLSELVFTLTVILQGSNS